MTKRPVEISPSHPLIREYHRSLAETRSQGVEHESALRHAFENLICVPGPGDRKGFGALVANAIPGLDLAFEKAQCFPFYTYSPDGSNRRENIADAALDQFRKQYADPAITKWDIFHYIYAVLHHPAYCEKFAENLKRELPRIPFAPDFSAFATAGCQLTRLHLDYEKLEPWPLEFDYNRSEPLSYRVLDKMRLTKDKTALSVNPSLTLADIPPEAFEYRLGNRSALEWVIDQ
jgi:predicted helicase